MAFAAIVIGVSSGGMNAMKTLFSRLPNDFKIPVIIVQHISPRSDNQWIKLLSDKYKRTICEADEKIQIENGAIYIAPANYHLLIERNRTFSLTIDERVSYARPSIDVLFESAADVYKKTLIGIILTGSNDDGRNGMKRIQQAGGVTIVQNPETAESPYMPASVIQTIKPDYILSLDGITELLIKINNSII